MNQPVQSHSTAQHSPDYSLKTAYLILAYEDPIQLKSLVSELKGSADVYIHINQRSDIKPFISALSDVRSSGKIAFTRRRYKIRWAGYGIVQATFELLDTALQNDSYDRIILLTGLSYPVKSPAEITKFFLDNMDINFVPSRTLDSKVHSKLKHYYFYDHIIIHRLIGSIRRIFPGFLKRKNNIDFIEYEGRKFLYRGNAPNWAITGKCAEYLLDFYKKNTAFNEVFRYIHAPDDLYVATVLYASHFRPTLETDNNIFLDKWTGNRTFDMASLEEILGSGKVYARKFRSGQSDELIRALHQHWGRVSNE